MKRAVSLLAAAALLVCQLLTPAFAAGTMPAQSGSPAVWEDASGTTPSASADVSADETPADAEPADSAVEEPSGAEAPGGTDGANSAVDAADSSSVGKAENAAESDTKNPQDAVDAEGANEAGETPDAPDAAQPKQEGAPAAQSTLENGTIVVEAEAGALSGDAHVKGSNGDGNFAQASDGQCIRWEGGSGQAEYTVTLPDDGPYTVQIYVGGRGDNGGGVDHFIWDGESYDIHVPVGHTDPSYWYVRIPFRAQGGALLRSAALGAGEHTFSIVHGGGSSSWCYYDKIEFVPDDSALTAPAPEQITTVEAESCTVSNTAQLATIYCDWGQIYNFSTFSYDAAKGNACFLQWQGEQASLRAEGIHLTAGKYTAKLYVGSRIGNSGSGTFSFGPAQGEQTTYAFSIADGTAARGAGWDAIIPAAQGEGGTAFVDVELAEGDYAFTVDALAPWCYIDKIELIRTGDAGPKPVPAETVTVEAETGTATEGSQLEISDGGGNFTEVSGGSCLRMWGGPATVNYTVELPADGKYTVRVYTGSRSDNAGVDKFLLDGTEYNIRVHYGAVPEWCPVIPSGADDARLRAVELTAGTHEFSIVYGSAAWCFYDKIEFVPDDGTAEEDPVPENVTRVEAESGTFTGMDSGMQLADYGDLNFHTISGGSCIRMWGGPARIDYTVTLPQDGDYAVSVFAGSRSDNSGVDTFELDGKAYRLAVPAGTAPDWAAVTPAAPESGTLDRVALTAGEHTFSIVYGGIPDTSGAAWCYYDKIEFALLPADPGPEPEPEPDLTVEAEAGQTQGLSSFQDTDCVRMWDDSATAFQYTAQVAEDGQYKVRVHVGSIETNARDAKFVLDGKEYTVTVPAQTDGWVAVEPVDAEGNVLDAGLKAGEHAFSLVCGGAFWCYFDKIEFFRTGDLTAEPEPGPAPDLTVEAEAGQTQGLSSFQDTDCVRMWDDSATAFQYTAQVAEDGQYKVRVYVGSIETNARDAKFVLDGKEYTVTVPAQTDGWVAVEPVDAEGNVLDAGLKAGEHAFSLVCGGAFWCYFDKIEFFRTGDLTAEPEPDPEPEPSDSLVIEAESGVIVQGSGSSLVLSDGGNNFTEVSGGSCIRMQGGAARINYAVNIPEDGTYTVYVYAGSRSDNAGVDKFLLDGTEYNIRVHYGAVPEWCPVIPSGANGTRLRAVELTAGKHEFSIVYGSAAWCFYDKIEFVPDDGTAEEDPVPENVTRVEAESGTFTGMDSGMQLADYGDLNFHAISGGSCIRMWNGPARIDYTVTLPQDGEYGVYVYAGSRPDNSGEDQFILDGEEYAVFIPAGAMPEWEPVVPENAEGQTLKKVRLTAGEHTFSLVYKGAGWCYYDKIEFVLGGGQEDPKPQPGEPITIEAERGRVTEGLGTGVVVSNGEGNFTEVSAGSCLRMWGGPATIEYTVEIPQADKYRIEIYVGSRSDNSGRDKFLLDGEEYSVSIPFGASPEWLAALPENALGREVSSFELTEGVHRFSIVYESAAWCFYDKIVFTPVTEDEPQPGPEDNLTLEAEKGRFAEGLGTGAVITSGDGNFDAVSGGSCIRMYTGPAKIDYLVEITQAGWYTLQATVGSINSDSGRDKIVIGDDVYYITVPAGTAPAWRQVGLEDELRAEAPPFYLAEGIHSFSLIYEGASWCYYDKFQFIPAELYTAQDVKDAAAALPAVEQVKASDAAAIAEALRMYNMLPEEEKAKVAQEDLAKLLLSRARCYAVTADPNAPQGRYQYEFEDGVPTGTTSIIDGAAGKMQNVSASGYAYIFDGGLTMRFYAPAKGYYRMWVASGTDEIGAKCDVISLNGGERLLMSSPVGNQNGWRVGQPGRERWSISGRLDPQPPAKGFWLNEGWNEVSLNALWGYACYDYLMIEPAEGFDFDGFFEGADVDVMAAPLPELKDVTLAHAEEIQRVHRAYMTLTRAEKDAMVMQQKLVMDNARINALQKVPNAPAGMLWYELEEGRMGGNSCTTNSHEIFSEYSGNAYVFIFDCDMEMDVFVPRTQTYDMWLMAQSNKEGDKCDYVRLNQGEEYLVATVKGNNVWKRAVIGTEAYEDGKVSPKFPEGGILMHAGKNLFEMYANWGYNAYDALILTPGVGSPLSHRAAELRDPRIGPGWPKETQEDASWRVMEQRTLDGETVLAPETPLAAPTAAALESTGLESPVRADGMARLGWIAAAGAAAIVLIGVAVYVILRRTSARQ